MKYKNHAQLVQGVTQVNDATLSQGELLFLNTLAAFNVKTDPHPGNDKLMRACRVKTRQGVNFLANSLVKKRLIEILEIGNGRGKATVYRIMAEDHRFPKPASSNLHVSDKEPASPDLPVSPEKPASKTSETRKLRLAHGFKPSDTSGVETVLGYGQNVSTPTRFALPVWIPDSLWNEFIQSRGKTTAKTKMLLIEKLRELRETGEDPAEVLKSSIRGGYRDLFPKRKPFRFPGSDTTQDHIDRMKRNARALGLVVDADGALVDADGGVVIDIEGPKRLRK